MYGESRNKQKRYRQKRKKEAAANGLHACSKCTMKLKLAEFDIHPNGTIYKQCRTCAEKHRKADKRCREKRKKEAAANGLRACSKCFRKFELSEFDSNENGDRNKTCRGCIERQRRHREKRKKEAAANCDGRVRKKRKKEVTVKTSTMASKECGRCKKRLKLVEFDTKSNGNLNKRCRRCLEKSRKVTKRYREKRKKRKLNAFDSKKNERNP